MLRNAIMEELRAQIGAEDKALMNESFVLAEISLAIGERVYLNRSEIIFSLRVLSDSFVTFVVNFLPQRSRREEQRSPRFNCSKYNFVTFYPKRLMIQPLFCCFPISTPSFFGTSIKKLIF